MDHSASVKKVVANLSLKNRFYNQIFPENTECMYIPGCTHMFYFIFGCCMHSVFSFFPGIVKCPSLSTSAAC